MGYRVSFAPWAGPCWFIALQGGRSVTTVVLVANEAADLPAKAADSKTINSNVPALLL
jgi:hypothetical protein